MIRVAVGIILRAEPRPSRPSVLLCQRREDAKYPLKWEFPGGKVEEGEDTGVCLAREIREELGVGIDPPEFFHREEAVYPDSGHYEVHYYLVRGISGPPSNRVFRRIEWVDVADLPSYDILEGNRGVVDRLMRDADAVGA